MWLSNPICGKISSKARPTSVMDFELGGVLTLKYTRAPVPFVTHMSFLCCWVRASITQPQLLVKLDWVYLSNYWGLELDIRWQIKSRISLNHNNQVWSYFPDPWAWARCCQAIRLSGNKWPQQKNKSVDDQEGNGGNKEEKKETLRDSQQIAA